MHSQRNKLDFTNQNMYVGFDIHKKSWRVSILLDNLFPKTFGQDPKPKLLHQHLQNNFPGSNYHTAYKAGVCGFWIPYALTSYGVNSMVVNAADIPTTFKEIIKKKIPEIPKEHKYRAQIGSKDFVKWLESVQLGSKSRNEALSVIPNLRVYKIN